MHSLRSWIPALAIVGAVLVAACGDGALDESSADDVKERDGFNPADAQRQGDPEKGYDYLVNGAYIRCGVPYSLYKKVSFIPDWLGSGVGNVPGRKGRNAELPYFLTAYTTKKGVDLVVPNCLFCHGGKMNGEVVVGLGNNDLPFQFSDVITGGLTRLIGEAGQLFFSPDEQEEIERFKTRLLAVNEAMQTKVQGTNPADSIPAASAAYRDPATLNWRGTRNASVMPESNPVPLNVPPWWRIGKKNALYYVAGQARGDHARLMMSAAIYCTDDVETAEEIDRGFVDVRAYLASLQAPKYPLSIDKTKARAGEAIYGSACASCHGTYGEKATFPNRWFPVDSVGTDSMAARRATDGKAMAFIDWYGKSWYGNRGMTKLVPKYGYNAPPLNGVWATAPFFHNGSVPTLEGVLDSRKRPARWTWSFDSHDYDAATMALPYEDVTLSTFGDLLPGRRGRTYDTAAEGYSNAGHTYGDALSGTDRSALLEYLKTL